LEMDTKPKTQIIHCPIIDRDLVYFSARADNT